MDCTRFRKYLGAFADGELDVQHNLDALEHLRMCPECTGRADEVLALKAALKRAWSEADTPLDLARRVQSAIVSEEGLETADGGPLAAEPTWPGKAGAQARTEDAPSRPKIGWWGLVPVGIAAAVVLGVWGSQPWSGGEPPVTTISTGSASIVSGARDQHLACLTRQGVNHHDESLSRDLPVIAERLSDRLWLAVIVPDFSDDGFELIGADQCGIGDREGAHVLYRSSSSGVWLSVFTVALVPELLHNAIGEGNGGDLVVAPGDDRPTVVAWRSGPQTHIVCASIPTSDLRHMVRTIRTAALSPPTTPSTGLATMSWKESIFSVIMCGVARPFGPSYQARKTL